MKKIIVGIFSLVLLLAAQNAFASTWNGASNDCRSISIANATTNEGYAYPCWPSSSVSADAGDTLNVRIYYHNTGTATANNTTVTLNAPINGSASFSKSFSGNINSDQGGLSLSTVTANLSSSQTITFNNVKWYTNNTSETLTALPNGQSGSEILSGGLNLGSIAPGWATQGSLVVSFHVSNTTPPVENCTISNFNSSPSTINKGDSSVLSWNTTNCNSVSISPGVGSVNVSGSQSVYPTSTTTYTLTAYGSNNVAQSKTTVVTVNQPVDNCAITSFTANPTSINLGGSSSLSWSTTNCISATISNLGYNVPTNGTQSVWPTGTTSYTLTAVGISGVSQTRNVIVTINLIDPVCSISSFSANPTTIDKGDSSALNWSTTNCTGANIYPTLGTVNTTGGQSVYPTQSTTYTLTAYGTSGAAQTRTVTVNVNQPTLNCAIGSFTANPTTIDKGDSSSLSWSTSNCTNVTIYPTLGTVNASGTQSVYPLTSTAYALTAYSANGSSQTRTVTVNVNQPTYSYCTIKTFTANSTSIKTNESVTLSWDTENCTSVNISGVGNNLAASGMKTVYPTSSITYILTGNSLSGTKPTRSLDITVSDGPSYACTIKTFSSNSTSIRANDAVTLTWDTDNCTSVTISGVGSNLAASGTKTIYPLVSTTYVLTGNSNGTIKPTKTIDITVTDNTLYNCSVGSFTAGPTSIILGGFSTLNWATSNCNTVTISNLGYNVPTSSIAGGQSVWPAQTTTYVLTAYGTTGAAQTRSVTITVTDPTSYSCVIKTFTANSTSIKTNESVTLSWDTDNCTSVTISGVGSNLAASGTKTVYPTASTTYTLTGNSASSVKPTRSIDITVTNNPTYNCSIKTFSANTTSIKEGDPVTITWDTDNCTSVDISNVGSTLGASGTKTIYPSATGAYTLTGNSADWTKPTRTINITVTSNPTYVCSIKNFNASNVSISKGDSTVLTWNTTDCTSVTISNLGYNVPVNSVSGGQSVWPTTTTTYTLIAYGATGTAQTKAVTVYVDSSSHSNKCEITSFSASDTNIQDGDSTILRWNTTDCDHVKLSGYSGNVSLDGSKTVYPTDDTTYTLTAYDTDGTHQTDTIKIYVDNNNNNNNNSNCSIDSFTASNTYVNQGNPVTLRWYTSNCNNVSVSTIGTVYASGSQIIYPTYSTNYILTASNYNGGSQTRSVYVTVNNSYIQPIIQPIIQPVLPVYNSCAVTTVATNVNQNGAQLNGIITSVNGANTYFEYGTSVNLGYRTNSRYVNGNVNFSDMVSGLAPNTIYYFRMNSDCQGGSALGAMEVFRTTAIPNANNNNTNTTNTTRTVVVQGTTVVGTASPILLNITNKYELIGQGDLIDYVVDYKNIGGTRLIRPMVQVILPSNVTLINASRGTYSVDDHTLSAPLEDLEVGQEGVIYLQAIVDSVPLNNSQIVTTAILVYTSANGSQENAMAYVLNAPKITGIVAGDSTLAGNAFFAGLLSIGLLGWLLILLLILIIILIARSYNRNGRISESKTVTHTTTQ
jgi:hypothetical protein